MECDWPGLPPSGGLMFFTGDSTSDGTTAHKTPHLGTDSLSIFIDASAPVPRSATQHNI